MRQDALFPTRNLLFLGDNLRVLRRRIPDDYADLIYLDPPFQSNQNYNVLFSEQDGTRPAAQIRAFKDTWRWDQAASEAFHDVIENAPSNVVNAMQALRVLLGPSDMLAYLAMMAPRLLELQRVLKPRGSLYLHCDPTASHYLKLLMDAIFGAESFQNEVIWHYRGGGVSKRRWGRRHDVLLFYSRAATPGTFNVDAVREPYSPESLDRLKYKAKAFRGKKVYDSYEPNPLGKHPDDVWDMQPIMPSAKERLGYPTQKPERLLKRVILASTNEGDLVLDPFCGCGTTVAVAQRLGRRWIGIDIAGVAIEIIEERLRRAYGPDIDRTYQVDRSDPQSLEDAERLARSDPHEFQDWVLDRLGARPGHRRGADRGIDGRIVFPEDPFASETREVIVSVKGGRTGPTHVRDLRGVVEREKAAIGVLVTLRPPTRQMLSEAATAGQYHARATGRAYPRLQIITVDELLGGSRIKYPPSDGFPAMATEIQPTVEGRRGAYSAGITPSQGPGANSRE